MLEGSIIAVDRGYASKDILELLTSGELPMGFIATCKVSKAHLVVCGKTQPAEWQAKLSKSGMREIIQFRRVGRSGHPVTAIGYRDIGENDSGVLMQYSGVPELSSRGLEHRVMFSLKPRNRNSRRQDVQNIAESPNNLIKRHVESSIGNA